MASEGLAADQLGDAAQQLKGQVTLSLENPSARMHRLATLALHEEPYRTIDQVLAEIDQVRVEDVLSVAQQYLAPDRQTAVWLGPHD
jgi:predicted Zn-dependent peptidase